MKIIDPVEDLREILRNEGGNYNYRIRRYTSEGGYMNQIDSKYGANKPYSFTEIIGIMPNQEITIKWYDRQDDLRKKKYNSDDTVARFKIKPDYIQFLETKHVNEKLRKDLEIIAEKIENRYGVPVQYLRAKLLKEEE